MNSGWLVWSEGRYGLWSGVEIEQLNGIPECRQLDDNHIRFVAGSDFIFVMPLDEGAGVYFSKDGINWDLSRILQDGDLRYKSLFLNADSGAISYIEDGLLQILSRDKNRSIGLPDISAFAACPTEHGEWFVVGCDGKREKSILNERAVAWVLRTGEEEWMQYNIQLSAIQRFLVRNVCRIESLIGLDVYRHPRIFLGDPQCLDDFSYETLLVEVDSGVHRIARFGVAEIYGFGRDAKGVPYVTTILGEYMIWSGKRFKPLGWKTALSKVLGDVEVPGGRTYLDILGRTVRGVYEFRDQNRIRRVYPVASDDFGRTWYRPSLPIGGEDWNIITPFVRRGNHNHS